MLLAGLLPAHEMSGIRSMSYIHIASDEITYTCLIITSILEYLLAQVTVACICTVVYGWFVPMLPPVFDCFHHISLLPLLSAHNWH